jgi:hypothetical protein
VHVPRKKRLQATGDKRALPRRDELIRLGNIHIGRVNAQAVSDLCLHGIRLVEAIIAEVDGLVELIRLPVSSTEAMALSQHLVPKLKHEDAPKKRIMMNCYRKQVGPADI